MQNSKKLDCLIIGGGPAGLTAAIYLARYRRSIAVVDAGQSRAALIPKTRNYPGFANGVSGVDLLHGLRRQMQSYNVPVYENQIEMLTREGDVFHASGSNIDLSATRVLLATGLVDSRPEIPNHNEAVSKGLVRYCPICDGFEAKGMRIAVLGSVNDARSKALFLRSYTGDVTLLATDLILPNALAELTHADVRALSVGAGFKLGWDAKVSVNSTSGSFEFDALYPVMGCSVRSELAVSLDAKVTDVGTLIVSPHQQTSIDGLYAAGDVVSDLHQIAVGTGHAAIAATAIHNSLPRNFI